MALHGGTGLDEDTIARCIANGCAKINISTNLKHVFVESFVDYNKAKPNDFEPLRYMDAQYQACKALFKSKIAEFAAARTARPKFSPRPPEARANHDPQGNYFRL
jgi:fructose/tagatose bisphosphate aldolase